MNKIEEQILSNQMTIMAVLRDVATDSNKDGYIRMLNDRRGETNKFLNPIKEPSIKEKTNDALCTKYVAVRNG